MRTIAATTVILGFLAGCGGKPTGGGTGGNTNPTSGAGASPVARSEWNHQDLFKYLRDEKGLSFRTRPDTESNFGVWMFFETDEAAIDSWFRIKRPFVWFATDFGGRHVVQCVVGTPNENMKDWVGVDPQHRHAWGRFTFTCSPPSEPHLNKLKAALQ